MTIELTKLVAGIELLYLAFDNWLTTKQKKLWLLFLSLTRFTNSSSSMNINPKFLSSHTLTTASKMLSYWLLISNLMKIWLIVPQDIWLLLDLAKQRLIQQFFWTQFNTQDEVDATLTTKNATRNFKNQYVE